MSNQSFDHPAAESSSTTDVAAQQAKDVARGAKEDGAQVADVAKGEVQQLAGEAKGHAQDLFHLVRSEATTQVSTQQQRIAGGLRTIAGELDQMAHGADTTTATGLVSQASGQVERLADWLEVREPADVLDEVRRYARRNPGTFLAGAALLGLVGGRLTRGLQADSHREDDRQVTYRTYPTHHAQTGYQASGYVDGGVGYGQDQTGYTAGTGYPHGADTTVTTHVETVRSTPSLTGDDERGTELFDQEQDAPNRRGDVR